MKIDPSQRARLKDFLVKKIKEEEKGKIIIRTPYKLTDTDLDFFHRQLPYLKDYRIENQINPDLIGGFVIIQGSKIVDASVLAEINNLKNRVINI